MKSALNKLFYVEFLIKQMLEVTSVYKRNVRNRCCVYKALAM